MSMFDRCTCGDERKENRHGNVFHGCHCSCHGGRQFFSKKERKDMLEKYRESLKNELEGVEEALGALQ